MGHKSTIVYYAEAARTMHTNSKVKHSNLLQVKPREKRYT